MGERISATEQARRAEGLRQIRHSTEMEGGRTDDATRADQDRWARGEITTDELGDAVKASVRAYIAGRTHVTAGQRD